MVTVELGYCCTLKVVACRLAVGLADTAPASEGCFCEVCSLRQANSCTSDLGFAMSDVDEDYGDLTCDLCAQTFGQDDKDKPPSIKDFISVQPASATASVCKPCYYVKRGSFQNSKQRALSAAMEEHPAVKEKFDALRSAFVQNQALHPKKKARHERCNLQELVKRSSEDYVDFQSVSQLLPLKEFLEKQKCKKTFRDDKERKKYITQTLKLQVQKDPKKGIWCVPVEDKTLMLSGHRVSASRVKQQSMEDRGAAKAAFESASSKIRAKTNSKDDVHDAHVADAAAGDSESQSDSSSDDSSDSSFAQLKSNKKNNAKAAKGSSSSDSGAESEPPTSTPVKEVGCGRGKGSEPGSGQKKRLSSGPAEKAAAAPVNKRAKKKISAAEAEKTSPKVKEGAEAYFALLHELTPDVLWRSCVRTAEVDRRLGRLPSVRSSLE
ncbi:unnamed protein product [Symbiodinium sp. CCMP2592]|nr:unnamed protein product [Symbiodinium sp. CCMP2592]